MKAWVVGYDGAKYSLPEIVQWEFCYGLGSPCDSFQVVCLWEPGAEKLLADAVRFFAEEDGQRVFTGVLDEYACILDADGSRLELSGRGMQALLLDNEALPVEYQLVTAEDILRRHAAPYGISLAGTCTLGAAAGFSVTSGQSEWSVIHDFACYHGGIVPWFDREGRLVLSGWPDVRRRLGDQAAVTSLRYAYKRYGVLSQVVVRDRTREVNETVNDTAFQNRGGSCRRVVCTAGRSTSSAMRYSGQYQLRASRAELETCEATVAELFAAWPGELMDVERSGCGANGAYRVREAAVGMNGQGAYTRLTLGPTDLLIG